MNDRLQNQLNLAGACINVAQSNEFQPVWNGNAPADFATDLASLRAQIADLDDLVIKFEDTTPGTRFATAWRQARSIIDAGSGPATEPAPITPVM